MFEHADVLFGPEVSDVDKFSFVWIEADVLEVKSNISSWKFSPVYDEQHYVSVAQLSYIRRWLSQHARQPAASPQTTRRARLQVLVEFKDLLVENGGP